MSEAVGILLCVHAGADPDQFRQALASMRAQTHPDVRLFVYCDGPLNSAHESALTEHVDVGDLGDYIIRGERPAGLASGLNFLIDYALSVSDIAYFARMDADDLSTPERITTQLRFLRDNPEVCVVGSWCIEFRLAGVPAFYKRMPTKHVELVEFMLYRSPLNHPTVMFRRSVFERGYRYDPLLAVMQDYDLWTRLVVGGVLLGNVPEYLLWFRVDERFYSRRSGFIRAIREVQMRIRFARSIRRLKPLNYLKYAGIFGVRMAPRWVKSLSYTYLRTV